MSLQKGLSVVKEATDLDKAENYKDAIKKYEQALLLFQKATKEEENPKTVNLIKTKMKEYNDRRKELREMIGMPAKSTTSPRQSKPIEEKGDYLGIGERNDVPDEFFHPPAIDWGALQQKEGKQNVSSSNSVVAPAAPTRNIELEEGILLLERATEMDQNKKFEDALSLYELGLEKFLKAYQNCSSPQMKKGIKQKMNTYLKRAEQLKKWLNSKKTDISEAAAPYLSKAIDTVQQAIDLDNSGQKKASIRYYEKAIELFRSALKLETNANARAMITQKMITYSARVEALSQEEKGGSIGGNISFGLKPGEKYVDPLKKKKWYQK